MYSRFSVRNRRLGSSFTGRYSERLVHKNKVQQQTHRTTQLQTGRGPNPLSTDRDERHLIPMSLTHRKMTSGDLQRDWRAVAGINHPGLREGGGAWDLTDRPQTREGTYGTAAAQYRTRETGREKQDERNRTRETGREKQDERNRTRETGREKQDERNRTRETGREKQDERNRTRETGREKQDERNRTRETGREKQDERNRMRETGREKQDERNRTRETGREKQDERNRMRETGREKQDERNRMRETGREKQDTPLGSGSPPCDGAGVAAGALVYSSALPAERRAGALLFQKDGPGASSRRARQDPADALKPHPPQACAHSESEGSSPQFTEDRGGIFSDPDHSKSDLWPPAAPRVGGKEAGR
ncbi:hypothetical protein NFI96_005380 [Prochilodus magdalenae]|nr:hypothetical protein NFI96_005380 [Prochilodus magdalenae]